MRNAADGAVQIVELAETLIARNVLSNSLHGNISLRREDGETVLMTGSSLVGITEKSLAVVDLDGRVVEGDVAPTEHEIIHMHTRMYRSRPEIKCIIHTHSPSATVFAVAGQPLPLVTESLARWGVECPIPVAQWAPRGSDEAVEYILAAANQAEGAAPAVLLANHGVLGWGEDASQALRRTIAIEENARLALSAMAIGGARELTVEMARSATARRDTFLSSKG